MTEWHTRSLAQRGIHERPVVEDLGRHPVVVLSASVLLAGQRECGEGLASLAARAGVTEDMVLAAQDGTRPVALAPDDEFSALADAVAVSCPRPTFETAAACDLLLSCVLDGDRVLATDVLVEPSSRDLAGLMIRLAVTGRFDDQLTEIGHLRPSDVLSVLSAAWVKLLRDRALALALSRSPDAWAGEEILLVCWGEQP